MKHYRGSHIVLFAVLLILAGPSVAQTEDWREVFSDAEQTIFVDASLMAMQGEVRMATVKTNYAQAQDAGEKTYQSMRTIEYFFCETRRWTTKALEAFTGLDLEGEVVLRHDFKRKAMIYGTVMPDTPSDAKLQFVCSTIVRRPE